MTRSPARRALALALAVGLAAALGASGCTRGSDGEALRAGGGLERTPAQTGAAAGQATAGASAEGADTLPAGATPRRALAQPGAAAAPLPAAAKRVVSLNPSLTAILLALGAGDALVGVDAFSARQQPAVAGLPQVGGLYDPSLEAVTALRPDLVVLVPSVQQERFRARLRELGVPVLELDPHGWDEVLASIRELGARTGRIDRAQERIAAIEATRRRVEDAVRGLPRPRAVLVLQRDPLFVAGAGTFLDDMLRAAGAENLGARLPGPYPRASLEWLVGAAPEVILDSAPGAEGASAFWARWPSLPAVAHGRVVALDAGDVTLPGPWLDRALVRLARALHGETVAARLAPSDG